MSTILTKCVCSSCESEYAIQYMTELSSTQFPEICPFCGEQIEEFDIVEDDSDDDYSEYEE